MKSGKTNEIKRRFIYNSHRPKHDLGNMANGFINRPTKIINKLTKAIKKKPAATRLQEYTFKQMVYRKKAN